MKNELVNITVNNNNNNKNHFTMWGFEWKKSWLFTENNNNQKKKRERRRREKKGHFSQGTIWPLREIWGWRLDYPSTSLVVSQKLVVLKFSMTITEHALISEIIQNLMDNPGSNCTRTTLIRDIIYWMRWLICLK